jgi:shikimate kinase
MNLILFGFKAVGKTHFGKRLAAALHLPFIDTDLLIHPTKPMREVHREWGDARFRKREKEAVFSLKGVKNSIIAVGGGAVCDKDNVRFLQNLGTLVYLDDNKKVVKQRSLSGLLPSYLDPNDPEKSFEEIYAQNKKIYEKIPAMRLDVSKKSEEHILEELMRLMEGVKNGQ